MNMKQVALGVTIALSSSLAMAANTAVVNFGSTINASTCVLNTSDKSQTVSLGTNSEYDIATSPDGQGAPVPFSFRLTDCGPGQASVSLTYTGETVANSYYLKNNGTSNAVIMIYPDSSDDSVFAAFDGTTVGRVVQLGQGDHTFTSSAFFTSLGGYPTPGTINATATMNLTYN